MIRKNNKQGFGFFFIIAIILALLVIAIIASIVGLKFVTEMVHEIGWEYVIIALAVGLAFVFRGFVESVLMTILGWIKAIVNALSRG